MTIFAKDFESPYSEKYKHQVAYHRNSHKSVSPIDPSCRKTIYNSREEAEEMIRHIQETRVVRVLRAYQCDVCGLWHLSSRSRS